MAAEAHLTNVAIMLRDPHPRRRRWSVTVAAVGLTVVLAGCGAVRSAMPGTEGINASEVVLTAYTQTIGSKSARVAMNETVTDVLAGSSTRVSISGTGEIDFASQDSEFSFSEATVGMLSERFITPDLYLEPPSGLDTELPAGTSWVEVNLNTVDESKLGESLSQVSDSSQASTQTLSYLEGVSSSGVTTVGPATIRGVATTEYKASVDLTKVAAHESAQEQTAVQTLETELQNSTIPLQVWLDDQGRVRQVAYQLSLPSETNSIPLPGSTTAAASSSFTATIDFYDFGTPVDVSAPPANQVDNVTSQTIAEASATTTTTPPPPTTTVPEECGELEIDSPTATALDPLLLTTADIPHGYATSGPDASTSDLPFNGELPQSAPVTSISFSTTTGPQLERIDESVARDTSAQAASELAHELQNVEATCAADNATVSLPGADPNLVATTMRGDDSSNAEVYTSKGPYLVEVSWKTSLNLYYTGKTGPRPGLPTAAVMSSVVDTALGRIPG